MIGRQARDRPGLNDLLVRVVHQGYGFNHMNWTEKPKMAGIAVPIGSAKSSDLWKSRP